MHNYYLDYHIISESLNYIEPTKENYSRYMFVVLMNAENNLDRDYAFEKGICHAINIYSGLYLTLGVDDMRRQWNEKKPKRINDIIAFIKAK